MMRKAGFRLFFEEHRTLFILIAVGLFLIELEIFALAAMKSGRESRMQVLSPSGRVIYEADGNDLSRFNKYYFEKTFGDLNQYEIRTVTVDRPFPFRAWFVAAVGIPVGVVLLFGFVIRAYTALFFSESQGEGSRDREPENPAASRLERIVQTVSRFNIFAIGALVLLGVLSYWVVPNLLAYIGRVGMETLVRYKWIFLALALIFLALVVWIIYLRYLLAKKTIESQVEVDKYRLQLEHRQEGGETPRIAYHPESPPFDPQKTDKSDGDSPSV